MIAAGELIHRVQYQEPNEARSTFGQKVKVLWPTQWTAWALVKVLSGREAEVARKLTADATHSVKLRGPRVIHPTGRFQWQDNAGTVHTLEICEPAKDGDGNMAELLLVCKEVPRQV